MENKSFWTTQPCQKIQRNYFWTRSDSASFFAKFYILQMILDFTPAKFLWIFARDFRKRLNMGLRISDRDKITFSDKPKK